MLSLTEHAWSIKDLPDGQKGFFSVLRDQREKSRAGKTGPFCQPAPGSEMVVESRSVKRNAKNARGLGRDTAPFPKSCASYFRFAHFNTFPLYYLRAWHRLHFACSGSQSESMIRFILPACGLSHIIIENNITFFTFVSTGPASLSVDAFAP